MSSQEDESFEQEVIRCKVKIYKLSTKMQRCPYIHEMKERLLGEQPPPPPPPPALEAPANEKKVNWNHPPVIMDQVPYNNQPVATVVKLNPDGYGSHTSPTHQRNDQRTPLMSPDEDGFERYGRMISTNCLKPGRSNAKTSLFIIMSFVYAKLLIVVCLAYVISDVVTHNIPLWYYEGFFTYLYGMSILFLLYVFCFLLQESTCCSGEKKEQSKKAAAEKAIKEKNKKKEEKEKKKQEKEKQNDKKNDKKDNDKKKKDKKGEKSTYRRNSEGVVDAGLSGVPVPVAEIGAQSEPHVIPQDNIPSTNNTDLEVGVGKAIKRKRKTSQSTHGSFFLRVGAIAFGLGTMIYNGLEFGSFFEIPFTSPCYMILRGVNPVLQMVFTFMQMYFIFMNSRLNIHRFKVIARFGLMHVVATNICVWIRTVILEYLKEITVYHKKFNDTSANYPESIRSHNLRNANTILGTHVAVPDSFLSIPTTTSTTPLTSTLKNIITTTVTTAATTLQTFTKPTTPSTTTRLTTSTPANLWRLLRASPNPKIPLTTTSFPTTTKSWTTTLSTTLASTPLANFFGYGNYQTNFPPVIEDMEGIVEDAGNGLNGSELLDNIFPQALAAINGTDANTSLVQASCGKINIMGTIVQDSAPYLFPFIVEYSLIGAVVIYVMWKHIGRNPKYTEEDLEHRLEVMLTRRAFDLAKAQNGRVDCVGASKGLFFGLLLLVGSLICLILFFVLIHHPDLNLLAIYLADVSHCALMALSIIAIIVGLIRVKALRFRVEEPSNLNDILLRISAFGLFVYATFSVIAGSLNAFTHEPNLLVMVTGILSIVQVVLQLLFIADISRRRVHLPEHARSKPGRQVVTFLLICNITMWIIYTFEAQKVEANPIQLEFYGFLAWAIIQRLTLPLCIFHRFHSAVTLAEIWKTSYNARLE